MIDVLKSFKSLIKLEKIHTDNNAFKLHYKVTVIMLLAFSILLTSKQYFGEPIICDTKEKEVMNILCWISGTFIVRNTSKDKKVPGLGLPNNPSDVSRQGYYQWVCIVFVVQALIFYVPRYLWKIWEGGRLRLLLSDITGPVPSPNWGTVARDKLVQYLLNGHCPHNIYLIRYCVCETLNFVNVIGQMYFLNWFITGEFSMYGIAYAMYKHGSHDVDNPMDTVFPKVTKCTYFKFGPSGTVQDFDALCVLPLNILNEKFFLILWYWLFILLVVSSCALIYRALFLFVPKFRAYLLRAQSRGFDQNGAQTIVKNISYGDFFILYRIGKNINPIMFKELVISMHDYIISKGKTYKNYPVSSGEV